MSRFSEHRLAQELAEIVTKRRPKEASVAALTLGLGLIGNFLFNKIEVAAILWLITLIAIGDLVATSAPIARFKSAGRFASILCVAGLGLLATATWMYAQYKAQHAALIEGDLVAASDGKDYTGAPARLQIGQSFTSFDWKGPKGKPLFNFANTMDKIDVKRVNGKLQISTTVRDDNGNLIVKIHNNHWEVSPLKTSCWDKNYTMDSLEVLDGRGRVVLQVRVLPDRIQLQAEWNEKGQSRPAVFSDNTYDPVTGIKPMFVYPSSEHWGEFAEDAQ